MGFVQPTEGAKTAPLIIVHLTTSVHWFYVNEHTSHLHVKSALPLQGYVITSRQRADCGVRSDWEVRLMKGESSDTQKDGLRYSVPTLL